ncbi:MAG: M13 family metallopeptidase [Pseudomonadota bacterium]
MTRTLLLGAALTILSACGSSDLSEEPAGPWGAFGLDLETVKPSVHPGDNFFEYVNGQWLDTFEIPADRARYGAFTLLADLSEDRVQLIIEQLADAAGDPDTPISAKEAKVAAYFTAFMDTDGINQAGLAPADPYLQRIAAIASLDDLADVFASNGFTAPVQGWVDVDSKQTDSYIFYFNQGGLGLTDRDMYLTDEGKNGESRAAYLDYLTFLLTRAGYIDAGEAAARVLALETEIAKAHWDRAAGRNRSLTYNKLTREELLALGGDFPTARLLGGLGLDQQDAFVVRQLTPDAEEVAALGLSEDQVAKVSGGGLAGIMALMASVPLDDWKAYLTAHFLSDHAAVLPSDIDTANFEFFAKTLRGQEEQRPRWKRAVAAVEGALGEAVGETYAARYFPAENKAAMDDLVANLRAAMADNLEDLPWMGEATRQQARDKLAKFTPKIGHTEKFETYDTMVVGQSAFENVMAASAWAYQDMISQLGQPIDETEWFMLPQTVNAYYSPNRNEIVFPAAILQPPFFNLAADPAVNYGAIGGVIGHEIGHGFDDQGSKSDGDGVLRDWWTPDDKAAFVALTDSLADQYDTFCPLDDGETCVNGRLSLGENTGDLGGLSMAYKAYRMSLNGQEAPILDGLTGDQRFFMSWAQVWRSKYREEALRQQLIRGPHSPPRYRVNGIVRNFDEWYAAFDVGPEHALYLPPEERIRIW